MTSGRWSGRPTGVATLELMGGTQDPNRFAWLTLRGGSMIPLRQTLTLHHRCYRPSDCSANHRRGRSRVGTEAHLLVVLLALGADHVDECKRRAVTVSRGVHQSRGHLRTHQGSVHQAPHGKLIDIHGTARCWGLLRARQRENKHDRKPGRDGIGYKTSPATTS